MTGMVLAPLPGTVPPDLTGPVELVLPRRRPRRNRRATLAVGDRVGAWRIDAELGRGGMGSVYAVTHHGFGKRAALKLCHEEVLGAGFTAQTFLREARIVHLIDHPGVCDVFATGTFRSRPYLVMERLGGETLGARLERGPLPREEGLELLIELCDVLAAAHAAGVVHRDLKLDNVFVLDALAAGGRRTKLLDWGVARIAGEPDPMREMVAGTISYVAPEQLRGDDLTPAADVYSLGVLAYFVLLGGPPFSGATDLDILRMHRDAAPPPPAERWPEIPEALAATLLAMLGKDPAQRPTVGQVRRALQEARAALTAPVRSPAPPRRWLWRVRGWLARLAGRRALSA